MAMSKSSLKEKLESELEAQGFVLTGEFAMAGKMAEAVANAVYDEITQNAEVPVTAGDSAGTYSVT
ncbi:TPA: hypothetical protein NJ528_002458 [Vibrio parahaemolyticus]|uniref:hypothetical protein n=1 Tax=Vibrio parahaemolyticus TaxID=670 RepID=UPI000A36F15B|nr:hypothetical protein [Vibrio parahaemolyticus]MBE4105692.1 hypothetical protein [Vibrio parahaemolyticus]MBE4371068.1 hypothetical protein [Vibrio parahaemolyticus]MBE5198971.1 hypothetical protein [Vibrio parahaemolyticus]OUD24799.1 hypothetical protein BUN10_11310 [Vibrio parahaemolyticus]TOJ45354.1 hypothetical protein CGI38_16085 [Vibrio parahaemolyticus]